MEAGDERGTCFSVWAPNAREVSVIGGFNQWDERANRLEPRENSGICEYGGSGMGNPEGIQAAEQPVHGRSYSLELTLPSLGVLFLKGE